MYVFLPLKISSNVNIPIPPSIPFSSLLFSFLLQLVFLFILIWLAHKSQFVPNMEAITASLERSLQNCSLNNNNNNNHDHHHHQTSRDAGSVLGISSSSDDVPHNNHISNSDTTLDLNSHISLPFHWEQCLDLKTGEIYYINWRNGMKAKEDPRGVGEYNSVSRDYDESVEEEEDEEGGGGGGGEGEEEEEEEESWYDSEESSSECSSKDKEQQYQGQVEKQNNNVLVVAGCKGCLMYFMVPKHVQHCPKCTAQLLHFDRSQNAPSP